MSLGFSEFYYWWWSKSTNESIFRGKNVKSAINYISPPSWSLTWNELGKRPFKIMPRLKFSISYMAGTNEIFNLLHGWYKQMFYRFGTYEYIVLYLPGEDDGVSWITNYQGFELYKNELWILKSRHSDTLILVVVPTFCLLLRYRCAFNK